MLQTTQLGPVRGERRGRWRIALVALAALATIAALQVSVPADAQAVDGLLRRSEATLKDLDPTKTVRVHCPADSVVLGGGGEIRDDGNDIARVTGLVPVDAQPRDYFEASAETIFEGQYEPWSLAVFAICAKASQFTKHDVFNQTYDNPDSATFVKGTASCPGGTVAYGAGGAVLDLFQTFRGRIALQMVRTSGPLDIGRATAREDTPLGSNNPWWLTSYVVCAEAKGGIHVEGAGDLEGDRKVQSFCEDPNDYVHGAGGGASGPGITDAGRSWLKSIVPSETLRSMTAAMVGPDVPSGGVVASHTCAEGR